MNKKGIVVSPPFKPIYTGEVSCGGDPDPIELRKYLMYWDEIDYPSNMLIHVSSPEIDYLEQSGKLKRTHVRFQGTISSGRGEFFIQAQEAAFRKNQDELTAFRCHMDEVNEKILSSRDVPRAEMLKWLVSNWL
ncbi:hypothetical protein [Shewanella benthica]|uniref:Uncharacterized protein n=1 Tax=Shewanella benthica KT99 TaxID=314608 RepID=A9DAT3_9GAMM|nr:hypothetical protein [Shewanella benthica]EDQ00638.1 hypothetical protein KT99_03794 [Shewanella benthica KT99]